MRLFVAIELPAEVQNSLYEIKDYVGSKLKNARWINPSNLHLTLQFLGECSREQAEEIKDALKKAVYDFGSFSFDIGGFGGFPSNRRPRVFWISATKGNEKILELQRLVTESLSSLGFKEEKKDFKSHITIARFKQPDDLKEALESEALLKFSRKEILVDKIVLFQSQLSPKGAQYTALEKIFLKSD
ncbi:MAG: RNA 2',3'-cyclic phosphodiesterase [Actinobacteria bacterium]|nr:RNA 2',3'-cyclic phosphodiesterase [Actinomycetota bacterium]